MNILFNAKYIISTAQLSPIVESHEKSKTLVKNTRSNFKIAPTRRTGEKFRHSSNEFTHVRLDPHCHVTHASIDSLLTLFISMSKRLNSQIVKVERLDFRTRGN